MELEGCDQMQQKSDENGESVLLSKTVGDSTVILKSMGEFLLCYCKQWECLPKSLI